MKFKVEDKVMVSFVKDRVGEILFVNDASWDRTPYLVGIKKYPGNNGDGFCDIDFIKSKGYLNQCVWCGESTLQKVSYDNNKNNVVGMIENAEKLVDHLIGIAVGIFAVSLMSIFMICIALMILGACDIIEVDNLVLGIISSCIFVLVSIIVIVILKE